MSHIKSFKSYTTSQQKLQDKQIVDEQATPVNGQTTTTTNQTGQTSAAPVQKPSIEANPTVISARSAVQAAIANRDKLVAAKQAELDKLKSDQDNLVNSANLNLNKALQDAAKLS